MKIPTKFTAYDKMKIRSNRYKILAAEIDAYIEDLSAAGVNFEFFTKMDEAMVQAELQRRLDAKDQEIGVVISQELSCEDEVPTIVYLPQTTARPNP